MEAVQTTVTIESIEFSLQTIKNNVARIERLLATTDFDRMKSLEAEASFANKLAKEYIDRGVSVNASESVRAVDLVEEID